MKLLEQLFEQETLTKAEAKSLLTKITEGELNDAQIVAAISALKMRSITAEELNGFRASLLEQAVQTNLDGSNAIDVCGTGGDGKNTFNISTLAAVVIAGVGYRVIKHGNHGVSSNVGSSTVLEELGYIFTNQEENLQQQLDETNLCFLHAPLFHPALKHVAPIRRALGTRTFFNYLGPLVNPVQPEFQLTGVYNLQLLRIYRQILSQERTAFKAIHSLDGYDEVSLTGAFKMASKKSEVIVYPEDLNAKRLKQEELYGGETSEESAQLFLKILKGEGTAAQNTVVLTNAALGIQCFNPEQSFDDAYTEAQEALLNKNALNNFKKSILISETSQLQTTKI